MNEIHSIIKNIQSGSRNLPPCSSYQGCPLHEKIIPVLPNGTHGRSGRQHPSGISEVYGQSGV